MYFPNFQHPTYSPLCNAQNADKFNSVQLINLSFIQYIDVVKLYKHLYMFCSIYSASWYISLLLFNTWIYYFICSSADYIQKVHCAIAGRMQKVLTALCALDCVRP